MKMQLAKAMIASFPSLHSGNSLLHGCVSCHCQCSYLIMVALWNRADHYIFILFLSSFFFFFLA